MFATPYTVDSLVFEGINFCGLMKTFIYQMFLFDVAVGPTSACTAGHCLFVGHWNSRKLVSNNNNESTIKRN